MFAIQLAKFRSNKASYHCLLVSILQILSHMYSKQLWIIICVSHEPYVGCKPFVMLLTEMLHLLIKVLAFMPLYCIECSVNVFLA